MCSIKEAKKLQNLYYLKPLSIEKASLKIEAAENNSYRNWNIWSKKIEGNFISRSLLDYPKIR
jgi:hypothetical protein